MISAANRWLRGRCLQLWNMRVPSLPHITSRRADPTPTKTRVGDVEGLEPRETAAIAEGVESCARARNVPPQRVSLPFRRDGTPPLAGRFGLQLPALPPLAHASPRMKSLDMRAERIRSRGIPAFLEQAKRLEGATAKTAVPKPQAGPPSTAHTSDLPHRSLQNRAPAATATDR